MKKVLFGLLALAVVIGGLGYGWYKSSYGGSGERMVSYEYKLPSYDKNGEGKDISFTATHNLRKDAYLKVTDNKAKGVTNWEEVQKNDLPSKAKDKLN